MLWQDPFELTRSDQLAGPHHQAPGIWRRSSEELAASGTGNEHNEREYGAERFSPIVWNTHRGIYETQQVADKTTHGLGTFTQSVVAFTAIWSLCELPLEVLTSRTPLESAACIAGKLVWLSLTLWALSGRRVAKTVFALFCGVSALSIATGLAAEQHFFAVGFCLSAVECALKTAALILIVWPAIRRVVR
jgi:hypothetical protein